MRRARLRSWRALAPVVARAPCGLQRGSAGGLPCGAALTALRARSRRRCGRRCGRGGRTRSGGGGRAHREQGAERDDQPRCARRAEERAGGVSRRRSPRRRGRWRWGRGSGTGGGPHQVTRSRMRWRSRRPSAARRRRGRSLRAATLPCCGRGGGGASAGEGVPLGSVARKGPAAEDQQRQCGLGRRPRLVAGERRGGDDDAVAGVVTAEKSTVTSSSARVALAEGAGGRWAGAACRSARRGGRRCRG